MNDGKVLCLWLGFLAVAMAGGILRDKLLIPWLGPVEGRACETLLLSAVIFELMCAFVKRLKETTQSSLFRLALSWTVLAVLFECFSGHYGWEHIGANYNDFQGRLWPLVLLVTLFGPLVAEKIWEYNRVRKSA